MIMVISEPEDKEPEWNQHWTAMETLARDLHAPVEGIRRPYEIVLKELNKSARVKVFLHLLFGRKVREIIK